jgi:hypothetical protein
MTLESARRWARTHVEENRARARAWYWANKGRAYERNLLWKRQNPERNRELNRRTYRRHHPRPSCVMCGAKIEPRQRFMCRACARLAEHARHQEWRMRRAA